jgi:hypothetical protein
MKRHLNTIALSFTLLALCASCQGLKSGTLQPAETPKDLGIMVAKAMLAGNSTVLEPCLLPYEAYAPILRALGADDEVKEEDLRKYYDREMKELREYVANFPHGAKTELGFDVSEVQDVKVEPEAQRKQFIDIRVILKTKVKTFSVRLDECILHEGHWYLVDID